MPRTEEQAAADEALATAIEGVARAYDMLQPGEVVLEFVTIAATQWMNENGDIQSSWVQMVKDGHSASSRILGLLEGAAFEIKYRSAIS